MRTGIAALTLLALLCVAPAMAQVQKPVQFGFKAGLNIANFTGEDAEGLDSRIGFVFGGFAVFNVSPYLAIQPELQYTQKGAETEFNVEGIDVNTTFQLDYLEVPVLLRFTVPTQGSVRPMFLVGPAVGLNVSGKVKLEALGESEDFNFANAASVDFGLILGGGAAFRVGTGDLLVDARYSLGLANPFDDIDDPASVPDDEFPFVDDFGSAFDLKNGVISITLGYAF